MKKYLIIKSIGEGKSVLTSFDNALLQSGIANYNLVKISSILPPRSVRQSSVDLPQGSVLHTAYASISTNKIGDVVSAAIAVGIPQDNSKIGVIMEFSAHCSKAEAETQVKQMCLEAMQNRGYAIKEILSEATEVVCVGNIFVTAFAALAIW